MDYKTIIQDYFPKIKEHYLSLLLFFVGFVLLSGGVFYSLHSNSEKDQAITFESGSSLQNPKDTEQKISVDVEGAVINPGVYSLNASSRVKDALISAGGLSSDADRNWIAKNLNLALKLSDSGKIYVPMIGESVSQTVSGSINSSGLVNINSANISELDSLPGIGLVTAQKIIDGRPYGSVNDLLSKKVIKNSVFEKIKDKITN